MGKKYTFILPCLNEEKTLEYCIKEIRKCIEDKKLDEYLEKKAKTKFNNYITKSVEDYKVFYENTYKKIK